MLCLGTRCLASVALAAALFSVPAFAQTSNSRITGVIRDSVGAPREGATVRATNDATGITRSATTRADGSYTVSGLTPGVYTVSASLIGFRRAARTNLQLDQDATVDLVIAPLPLQAITVTATLREEQLSEVPFSVAAPTAADLRERGAPTESRMTPVIRLLEVCANAGTLTSAAAKATDMRQRVPRQSMEASGQWMGPESEPNVPVRNAAAHSLSTNQSSGRARLRLTPGEHSHSHGPNSAGQQGR